MSVCDLQGARVLVTRPLEQSARLVSALGEIGALAVVYPGVRIVEVESAIVQAQLARLGPIDVLVFVSPTAVRLGLAAIARRDRLPENVKVAAVGPGTAAELEISGMPNVIVPLSGSGGDALAACEALQELSGKSVLIIRGEGGRDALAATLRERGAHVSFLECYRRQTPECEFDEVASLLRDRKIIAWTVTSGEILDNVLRKAGKHGTLLRELPLFVSHPHIAVRGFSESVRSIFVAKCGDNGLVAGIASWFCGPGSESTNTQVMQ